MTYNEKKFLRSLHKGIKIDKGFIAGTRCKLCGKPIAKRDIERYMMGNLKVCRTCFNREGKLGEEKKKIETKLDIKKETERWIGGERWIKKKYPNKEALKKDMIKRFKNAKGRKPAKQELDFIMKSKYFNPYEW